MQSFRFGAGRMSAMDRQQSFKAVRRAAKSGLRFGWGAMQSTDLKDLDRVPEKVIQTARMLALNTAHSARMLKAQPYPGDEAEHAGPDCRRAPLASAYSHWGWLSSEWSDWVASGSSRD